MNITIVVENPDKTQTTHNFSSCSAISDGPTWFKFKGKKQGDTTELTYRFPVGRIISVETNE